MADHYGVDDGHAHPTEFREDQGKGEPDGGAQLFAKNGKAKHDL
jgi:hypothetical protein